jgi:hypothetical protein
MSVAISRFKLPETLDDVPEDIREAMLAVELLSNLVYEHQAASLPD